MNKKFLFHFICLNFFIAMYADNENLIIDGESSDFEFTDILEVDDDEQLEIHKHDAEEEEIEALEEFAEKPTPPSQATILMRQFGLKMLIGYLAMRSYIENMWARVRTNVVRFKSWVLNEHIG
ncbi:MAG: hypothetical protein AB7F19_02225 [Candidatus Babeliales bacterium]